jgi:hypothetical protein
VRAISRRLLRLESIAEKAQAAMGFRMRIEFVSAGEVPGTRGDIVRVFLFGDGWTDAEREAALEENAELARLYPDTYGRENTNRVRERW